MSKDLINFLYYIILNKQVGQKARLGPSLAGLGRPTSWNYRCEPKILKSTPNEPS